MTLAVDETLTQNHRVNDLKFGMFLSFCSQKMLVIIAGIYKRLVRIATREKSDRTA